MQIMHRSNIHTSPDQCLEFQTPMKINFIDFKAAFDSVHRKSLWNNLIMYGIPVKIVNIIRNIFEKSECCVQNDGKKDRNGSK